ncbi:MAG: nucleoside 2-deoxyribosyltransferase [Planctomycetaceae bacterium]|nr:nucleoside 2-deoxyribosyltransferase [Planctomycetaceae bacterium]
MPESSPRSRSIVYCAGPLFNQSERDEMTSIAELLTRRGFGVYLPHRDGMEFRLVQEELTERGWSPAVAGAFLHAAIFALDIFQLVSECDSVVWNLNGRVPDEGAVSEAAIAWTLGKPKLAYKEDVRSMISGRDNPLLVGLVEFETLSEMDQIPDRLEELLSRQISCGRELTDLPAAVQKAVGQGSLLWTAMQDESAVGDNSALADVVAELFAPKSVS